MKMLGFSQVGHPGDLKELRRVWYQRLKDEGFIDIESPDGELIQSHLSQMTPNLRKVPGQYLDMRREYYVWATRCLIEFTFECRLHFEIWELHSEGCSQREIERVLRTPWARSSQGVMISRTLSKIRRYLEEQTRNEPPSIEDSLFCN